MTVASPATTLDETPFFVRANGEDVMGIITEPTGPARNVSAFILTGGAYVGATNRNRVSVRIARELAAQGYHAVRMDYHGTGDSTGEFDLYPLHRPWSDDILPAVEMMEARGITRTVLVGTTCFGARTALHAAVEVRDLAGVALYACPTWDFPNSTCPDDVRTRHYVRQFARRSTVRRLRADPNYRAEWLAVGRWKAAASARQAAARVTPGAPAAVPEAMSPAFHRPLAALAERGAPVLLGYGVADHFWDTFQVAARSPRLRRLLDAPGSRIEVETVPGSIHALRRIAAQDAILRMTLDWLARIDPAGGDR
jgi:alpha/beta superfamily hydrolase